MGDSSLKEVGVGGIVNLNVGGTIYTTTISTLTAFPDSMLGAMFKGDIPTTLDARGNYFIDRDGRLFRYVLNYLRTFKLNVPDDFGELDQLLDEADFYQIPPLIDAVEVLDRAKKVRRRDKTAGVFIEVKDHIECYKGWHINTSLTGPLFMLMDLPPFVEELPKLRFYRTWREGNVEEVFMEKGSKTRLEWAIALKKSGWDLICSTSTSTAVAKPTTNVANVTQQFTTIDKWFLPLPAKENTELTPKK
ncbi:BTB/POZ domain-containing protein KCTD4-like [Tubulanus polymorphus]|uniref:BTB/POZ domain-containing protein KCTD4-like n=1 Tax=Tubulanus polymorphus TaxID=672921 RepID=UPI003DA3AC57